jgi:uncharacterized membrane protein YfcA
MNPNTQLKIFKFLEKLWLVAAAIGVILTIYFLTSKDNDSALFFFGFFILSALLYLLRKRQRVKYETAMDKPERPRVK